MPRTEAATSEVQEPGPELSVEDRFKAMFADPVPEGAVEPGDATTGDIEPDETDEIEAADELEDELDDEFDDDEAGAEEESEDEATYTVRVAGEDVDVTLPELLAGYSRTGDYKRKTQELADQRREIATVRQDLTQQVEQYAAALPRLQQLIESSTGPEPDPNAYPDRADYLFAKDQWNTAKLQADAVQREQQRIESERQSKQVEALENYKAEHAEKLLQKLPEWNDAAVRQREQSEVSDYLRSEGFEDQEIAQLWDHRAIILARKARLYDQLQATGKTKVKGVKPKAKTAAPGSGDRISTRGRANRKQRERLTQTGSVHDAAPLFQQILTKR